MIYQTEPMCALVSLSTFTSRSKCAKRPQGRREVILHELLGLDQQKLEKYIRTNNTHQRNSANSCNNTNNNIL
nr:MAG TPA: hypothetical protein [Microviridae sp.]